MDVLFSAEYRNMWALALAFALWFPVRNVIWVMTMRRAVRKAGEEALDEPERHRLRRRAGFTAALICAFFSFAYMGVLFKS
jgi:hypothetical protein